MFCDDIYIDYVPKRKWISFILYTFAPPNNPPTHTKQQESEQFSYFVLLSPLSAGTAIYCTGCYWLFGCSLHMEWGSQTGTSVILVIRILYCVVIIFILLFASTLLSPFFFTSRTSGFVVLEKFLKRLPVFYCIRLAWCRKTKKWVNIKRIIHIAIANTVSCQMKCCMLLGIHEKILWVLDYTRLPHGGAQYQIVEQLIAHYMNYIYILPSTYMVNPTWSFITGL